MPEPYRIIPIYDDATPIACTIGVEEIPERIELLGRMRANLTSMDRTATGLMLRFPDAPAVRADVARFAIDEKRCCQFWGFDVSDEPEHVALRWDAPPQAVTLLAKIETFFRTDAPISILDGLL
jgi:hypothetical protein